MLFSSMLFLWFFLPFTFLVYRIVPNACKNAFLLLMSLIFYSWGEPIYVFLMLASITVNYWLALCIHVSPVKKNLFHRRNMILILAIVYNIGFLWWFKYSATFAVNFNYLLGREVLRVKEIALPLGISFYTFQALSYVIDVYWKKCDVQKKYLNLALYITFFPQLVAGPIVKYKDVEAQIVNRSTSMLQTSVGIKRFIYGLSKKVIISNSVAEIADKIFACSYDSIDTKWLWVAVLLYTLQIYYDFSGYSDMAIGLGKMFGFEFVENFNYPYVSRSIQEFWRRWHISLSTWFKEYVYIPLGGNRKGKYRTYANLVIVFVVTGVWHGATLNFLVWGIYYAFFIVMERIFLSKILERNPINVLIHVYTMFVVSVGWALFRCDSLKEALKLIRYLFKWQNNQVYKWYDFFSIRSIVIVILAVLLIGFIQENSKKVKAVIMNTQKVYTAEFFLQIFLLAICMVLLISGQYNPFIYFKF